MNKLQMNTFNIISRIIIKLMLIITSNPNSNILILSYKLKLNNIKTINKIIMVMVFNPSMNLERMNNIMSWPLRMLMKILTITNKKLSHLQIIMNKTPDNKNKNKDKLNKASKASPSLSQMTYLPKPNI